MNATFKRTVSVSIFALGFAMAYSVFAYGHDVVGARAASDSSQSLSTSIDASITAAPSKAVPPDEALNFATIMDEMGALESQQNQTLTQQQTAEIDAIGLQAKDTLNQASQMMQGAGMMMTMATAGLAVSMATSGVSMSGVGQASKEGDESEEQPLSISEQEAQLFTITWSEPPQSDFRREEPAPLK